MVVSSVVRATAPRFILRLSRIAARFSIPPRIPWKIESRIWMLSATASVRMIVGAGAEAPVSSIPSHPPSPRLTSTEKTITSSVATMPVKERSVSAVTRRTMPYMIGVRVIPSPCACSQKALLTVTMPPR